MPLVDKALADLVQGRAHSSATHSLPLRSERQAGLMMQSSLRENHFTMATPWMIRGRPRYGFSLGTWGDHIPFSALVDLRFIWTLANKT